MSQDASRNALAVAVLALLNGSTGLGGMATPRTAYEWDDAPETGGDYVLFSLSRMFGGNRRVGNQISPSMWRLTTRAVGTVTNVGAMLDRCTRALEHQTFTVVGIESTGIQFESEDEVGQDDDDTSLWSGLRSWTFAF